MNEAAELAARAAVIGVGATAIMDVWGQFVRVALGLPPLDLALLGRWIGHFPRGRFRHARIADAERVRGERVIGWCAHYGIGVAFATLLLAGWGLEWARAPTPGPALLVGIVTLAAPLLVLQPAMGAGIASSRTPAPNVARAKSVATHVVYGLGLYAAAWLAAVLGPAGR